MVLLNIFTKNQRWMLFGKQKLSIGMTIYSEMFQNNGDSQKVQTTIIQYTSEYYRLNTVINHHKPCGSSETGISFTSGSSFLKDKHTIFGLKITIKHGYKIEHSELTKLPA
jgi:hypothetical protein